MRSRWQLSRPPEHWVWRNMIQRCEDPGATYYHRYGGRGIRVCERWRHSLSNFMADMGPRPSPEHQIDRIDNDGNYEPGNCRWATRKEQQLNRSSNRRITAFGRTQTLSQWALETGMRREAIARRLNVGDSPEDALSRPITEPMRVMYDGALVTLSELSDLTGMPRVTLWRRLRRSNWNVAAAINGWRKHERRKRAS